MKHIPKDFILDLMSRMNIVDVIGHRIKLQKKGHNYFGCCPFHNEKTPSFSVSDKKQMYHCFGCGVSGDIINFMMDYERLTFPEAIEELATIQGIEVPYENDNAPQNNFSHQNSRKSLYELMGRISQFYQMQLATPEAKPAFDYLSKRGLNQDIIAAYQIGYSPDDWNKTERSVLASPKEKELYEQAGMAVINDNNRSYDRFRGRIMFPIRDRQGNVIGFGGRTIKSDDNVKYLNSPETTLFHKGKHLYGLYEVLEFNRNPEQILVVEGYMDVVALAQFGVNYAVASLGTATTEEQVKLLFRTSNSITFCYDGDNAGRRAAWRVLETLLPLIHDGKAITFVFLPEGEDPDSLIRQEGKAQFETRISNGIPLSQFLFDEILKEINLSTPEGKARFTALAIPLIEKVEATSFQLSLKQQFGSYLGILDLTQIELYFQRKQKPKERSESNASTRFKMKLTTMRILIGLLVQYPYLVSLAPDLPILERVNLAGIDLFKQLVTLCKRNPTMTTAQLLLFFKENDPNLHQQLTKLSYWDHQYDEENIEEIFSNTLKSLYDNILSQRGDELIAKERTSGLNQAEKKELMQITLVLSKKD